MEFVLLETIDGVLFGRTQVTQAQWRAVAEVSGGKLNPDPSHFKGPNRPVEQVSWHDCQLFCEILNEKFPQKGYKFRLPTQKEWRAACGPDPENLGNHAWYEKNSGGKTHDVGLKRPNGFGLCDMLGNVWEWCGDEYELDSNLRVIRGGCFWNFARDCRSAYRFALDPGDRSRLRGFRLAAGPVFKSSREETEVGAKVSEPSFPSHLL